MFSYKDIDGDGIPIAKQVHGRKIVYLNPIEDDDDPIIKFETVQENIPLPTKERQVIFAAGAQNSGKSYRVAAYIYYWLRMFPDRPVTVISRLDHDETFCDRSRDGWGNLERSINRLKPSVDWIENKFQLEKFSNQLVVFDDVISSKWSDNPDPKDNRKENNLIQDYIFDLAKDMAQNGRHNNIQLFITSHDLYTRGSGLSKIIVDCTDFVMFPDTSSEHHLNYFLKEYVGLTKPKIDLFKTLKSRWIWIHKNSPRYFMYQNGLIRYDLI